MSNLMDAFGQKSFAICFVLLMAISALPLPTGGVTHVFEIINMLLAAQYAIGMDHIWLPRRWQNLKISPSGQKAVDMITRRVRWVERFSRPRLAALMKTRLGTGLIGLAVLLLTLAAFLSPPFSGLDTLPSLGVVIIGLAIIFEDGLILLGGLLVGIFGVFLEVALGDLVTHWVRSLFRAH